MLKRAAKTTGTMPPEGALSSNIKHYSEHRDWRIARCDGQPGEDQVVPVDVPTEVGPLPPPIVGPLYACTRIVQVSGARLGARLLVAIDGSLVDDLAVQELSPVFTLQEALEPGQLVEVYQTFGSEVSEPGSAIVYEHQEDYPDGLPPPLIVPDTAKGRGRGQRRPRRARRRGTEARARILIGARAWHSQGGRAVALDEAPPGGEIVVEDGLAVEVQVTHCIGCHADAPRDMVFGGVWP